MTYTEMALSACDLGLIYIFRSATLYVCDNWLIKIRRVWLHYILCWSSWDSFKNHKYITDKIIRRNTIEKETVLNIEPI